MKRWKTLLFGLVLTCGVSVIASETKLQQGIRLINENKLKEAEKILLPLVKENNAEACYRMGLLYVQKKGDLKQGAFYLKKSTELGNQNAKYMYALMLSEGYGTAQNIPEAVKLLKEIADKTGDQDSCYQAGRLIILLEPGEKGLNEALVYLEKAARPDKKNVAKKGNKTAQLLAGVIHLDRKNYEKAYFYLEAAAEQDVPEAWRKLGTMYHNGFGIGEKNYKWAKLCFLAEYRLSLNEECAFNIGVLESEQANLEEALKWMKIAAAKKYKTAEAFLKDKNIQAKIAALKARKEKPEEPLGVNFKGYFNLIERHFGTKARKTLDQTLQRKEIQKKGKMIRMPQPENLRMSGWIFEKEKAVAKLHEQLIKNRDGIYCLFSEEFSKQPLQKNLAALNPSIRWINSNYEDAFLKVMNKSIYQKMSQKETDSIIKKMNPAQLGTDKKNQLWKIGGKLHFNVCTDYNGRWQLRYYQFIIVGKTGVFQLASFETPPSAEEADMIYGVSQTNLDSLNNLGIYFARSMESGLNGNTEDAELLFQTLMQKKHYAGTYNLGVLYQEQGKKELAEKYFKLAEEFKKQKK